MLTFCTTREGGHTCWLRRCSWQWVAANRVAYWSFGKGGDAS